jgi:hypothetical protein
MNTRSARHTKLSNASAANTANRLLKLQPYFMVTPARTYPHCPVPAPKLIDNVFRWNHFTNPELRNNHDDLLRAEVGHPEVSFVFQYISH